MNSENRRQDTPRGRAGEPSPIAEPLDAGGRAASITIGDSPELRYVLRLADTCLIHAQRLTEWCGHAPVLEEDIALSNLALDLLGQARALLTHAGAIDGRGYDEDRLAFLREERDYLNLTLVEQPLRRGSAHSPGGDFADTQVRNLLLAVWLKLTWERLQSSSDAELAAVAGKAVKEARYHVEHAAGWVIRLGDGTQESSRRTQAAIERIWPFTAEMFADDEVDRAISARGIGPARSALLEPWLVEVQAVIDEAGVGMPGASRFISSGSRGMHSEHLGFVLAEMQSLQRTYPGGVW